MLAGGIEHMLNAAAKARREARRKFAAGFPHALKPLAPAVLN
jgi:hypothetical protein